MMKSVLADRLPSAWLIALRAASRAAVVCVGLITLFVAGAGTGIGAEGVADLPMEDLSIVSVEATHEFKVEVASTDRQRAQGLMLRETMAGDHGMLFVFDAEGDRYFWMKDTPLSLDIIFADADGVIVRIAERTTPFSQKIIPSREAAMFVLELNAGQSEKLGISAGDRLVSPSISAVR
ncbi:DUF192 domain-containing protein [Roseibium algae]|uniref:DUF192 domain-containing protein n=1 Tax=Roseibium algae TaxID=3123038 RepID=A0ABU8TKY3_9HYPH